tara:strand:+ start:140 stop:421 length:282 start_codon:yes stop_codon:yes gene_type:complete
MMVAQELRRLAEEEDGDTFPGWLIPVAVSVGLVLMIMCLVCCTMRCFSPDGTKEPLWTSTEQDEEQSVRPTIEGEGGSSNHRKRSSSGRQSGV